MCHVLQTTLFCVGCFGINMHKVLRETFGVICQEVPLHHITCRSAVCIDMAAIPSSLVQAKWMFANSVEPR